MKTFELQEQFLKSIQDANVNSDSLYNPILNLTRKQCLEIYRKGYRARLTEALGSTFEACWWVLGDEGYFKVAADYISQNPSQAYDLSDYGVSFPEFLKAHPESADIPFIQDLARFEWTFKEVFHQQSLEKHQGQISQITGDSILKLNSSCVLMRAEYDVHQIWKKRTEDIEVLSEVAWENPAHYLVCRSLGQIYIHSITTQDCTLLSKLQGTQSLEEVLSAFSETNPEVTPEFVGEFFQNYTRYLTS